MKFVCVETPGLSLPKCGDWPLSTMIPLMWKFPELPPLTSSTLPKSRDRPPLTSSTLPKSRDRHPAMSESHIVTDRGHLSPSTPVRRTLSKPRVRLPATPVPRFLPMLIMMCCMMITSDASK